MLPRGIVCVVRNSLICRGEGGCKGASYPTGTTSSAGIGTVRIRLQGLHERSWQRATIDRINITIASTFCFGEDASTTARAACPDGRTVEKTRHGPGGYEQRRSGATHSGGGSDRRHGGGTVTFTPTFVKSVRRQSGWPADRCGDGRGLMLQVIPSGSKQWLHRLALNGPRRASTGSP